MPAYTITDARVAKKLPPSGDRPELVVHAYSLREAEGEVERVAKPSTALPSPGDVIEGTIEPGRFGPQFKVARRDGGGGFRGRSPEETKAIQRQHSQEMALRYVASKVALGKIEDFSLDEVKRLTDAFERDLDPAPPQPSDVPADMSGLPSQEIDF